MCDLTEPVGLSQPTVSHHLKILIDAGLLTLAQARYEAVLSNGSGDLDAAAVITAFKKR